MIRVALRVQYSYYCTGTGTGTGTGTVLYCTVLYCTVLYCTVLYCTVLYCTVLVLVPGGDLVPGGPPGPTGTTGTWVLPIPRALYYSKSTVRLYRGGGGGYTVLQ